MAGPWELAPSRFAVHAVALEFLFGRWRGLQSFSMVSFYLQLTLKTLLLFCFLGVSFDGLLNAESLPVASTYPKLPLGELLVLMV